MLPQIDLPVSVAPSAARPACPALVWRHSSMQGRYTFAGSPPAEFRSLRGPNGPGGELWTSACKGCFSQTSARALHSPSPGVEAVGLAVVEVVELR